MFSSAMATLITLLFPMAPHIASELWERLGHAEGLDFIAWPSWDSEALKTETLNLPLQINGKLRGQIVVSADLSKEDLEKTAVQSPVAQKYLKGQPPRKIIIVAGKLINIVAG